MCVSWVSNFRSLGSYMHSPRERNNAGWCPKHRVWLTSQEIKFPDLSLPTCVCSRSILGKLHAPSARAEHRRLVPPTPPLAHPPRDQVNANGSIRCANQITRIALREFCVRHVSPTGSDFLSKPTQDWDCFIPISDTQSGWIGGWSVGRNHLLLMRTE